MLVNGRALAGRTGSGLLIALCAARGATSSYSPRCPGADGADASSLVQAWVRSSARAQQEPRGEGDRGTPATIQPNSSPEAAHAQQEPRGEGGRGALTTLQPNFSPEDAPEDDPLDGGNLEMAPTLQSDASLEDEPVVGGNLEMAPTLQSDSSLEDEPLEGGDLEMAPTLQSDSSLEDEPLDGGNLEMAPTLQSKDSSLEDETGGPRGAPTARKPGARHKVQYAYNVTEWERNVPHFDMPELQPSDAGKVNLCMYGHFIPELLLIGAVKAATTTFAGQFAQSPNALWSHRYACEGVEDDFCMNGTTKEGHHFDFKEEKGPVAMANRYPECRHDIRYVATDMSPRYMVDPTVPVVINSWYGTRVQYLKFIIILREPVARFHSDYYHAIEADWCGRFAFYTFEELVRGILNQNLWYDLVGGTGNCPDRLQASKYVEDLRRWFDAFDPKQFTIVPMRYVTDPGKNTRPSMPVASYMWSLLGIAQGTLQEEEETLNDRRHPSLLRDLGRSLLDQFTAWLYATDGPRMVASLLAHRADVNLFGYTGQWDNAVGISVWLERNW